MEHLSSEFHVSITETLGLRKIQSWMTIFKKKKRKMPGLVPVTSAPETHIFNFSWKMLTSNCVDTPNQSTHIPKKATELHRTEGMG